MSYEIDIREELTIHNRNEKTREAAAKLGEYIRQFNKMDGLSGMQIYAMELGADEKIAWTEDELSTKECGYIFTDDASGTPLLKLVEEDYTHWDEEEDVAVLLEHLEDAREIHFYIDCSLIVTSETSYGAAYWQEYLQRQEEAAEDLRGNLIYRDAEFYTAEDPVCCYVWENGAGRKPTFDSGAEDVADCPAWYSYCLRMAADGLPQEGIPGENAAAQLSCMAETFAEKYDLESPVPEAEGGSWRMEEELGIFGGEEEELIADLQQFADFAKSAGADFSLRAEFFSDAGEFQFLSLGIEEDGRIRPKFCCF